MINDIKLGFKMLRYAHGLKGSVVLGGIFLVLGMIIMMLSDEVSAMGGNAGFLIMIIGMLPPQLIYSLNVTSWVQSSPAKKRMQTSVPVFCGFVSMSGIFTVITLFRGIKALLNPQMLPGICSELLVIAFLGAIVILYMAISYKCFLIGTLLFLVAYFTTFIAMTKGEVMLNFDVFGQSVLSLLPALALGILILAVATILGYGISLLVYKLPISKMSQPATLRKHM